MDDNIPTDNKDSKEREKPFGRHFVNIAKNCKSWINSNPGKNADPNPCYNPKHIKYLLHTTYLYYLYGVGSY